MSADGPGWRSPIPPAAPCAVRYALTLTTSGWFEVEAFDAHGNHLLRRYVPRIEEASWLLRVPLVQARSSELGEVR